jgi:hypothetical protein
MKIMDGLLALGCAVVFTASLVPARSASGPTGGTARAASNAPAASSQKFLFVVDIGASMREIDTGTRQVLFDLIYSGIGGQMKKGDTFGIWTYNEQVVAGKFPMLTWDPEREHVVALASAGSKFLQAQKCEGKSVPQLALARVASIVRNVKDVNVLLITDGKTPLLQTAFDHQVNPVYEQRKRECEKAKKPLITTFIARAGAVTNASVILAGEPILIPPPSPPQPKIAAQQPKSPTATGQVASAPRIIRRTNSTPLIIRPSAPLTTALAGAKTASTNSAPEPQEIPAPIVHPADFIGSNEALASNAPPARTTTAASPTRTDASPSRAGAPAPAPAPALQAKATAATNVSNYIRSTNTSALAANPLAAVFADTPVAAREVAASNATQSFSRGPSSFVLITVGGLLLGGAVILIFFGTRRIRAVSARPSFISQSIERR